MTMSRFSRSLGLLAVASTGLWSPRSASAQTVRAVMFYSPTCPHCEQVIRQDLPVFFGMYGGDPQSFTDESAPQNQRYLFLFTNGQLEILLINASLRAGGQLFEASFGSHGKPSGVPRLILDNDVLVGSIEIPNRLHDLIQAGLAKGGVDWPSIPGLAEAIAGIPQAAPLAVAARDSALPETTPVVDQTTEQRQAPGDTQPRQAREAGASPEQPRRPGDRDASEDLTADSVVAQPSDSAAGAQTTLESVARQRSSMLDNFRRDPIGNGLSVLVLIGMIASLILVPRYARPSGQPQAAGLSVPVLSLVGIAVAAYLTYIEVGQVTAVCGPVGDCNTVNQSEYARLFGVIPVGALGLAGYVAIIATWAASKYAVTPLSGRAAVALFAGTVFGTLFSVYLTFLEPFVIGATCAWCLTSAVIITVLMWLSAKPAMEAWAGLGGAGNGGPGTGGSPEGGA